MGAGRALEIRGGLEKISPRDPQFRCDQKPVCRPQEKSRRSGFSQGLPQRNNAKSSVKRSLIRLEFGVCTMPVYMLGIHDGHNASACLLADGEIVFRSEEHTSELQSLR